MSPVGITAFAAEGGHFYRLFAAGDQYNAEMCAHQIGPWE